MKINQTFEYLSIGLPENIEKLKTAGYFEEATRLIDLRLSESGTSYPLRQCLIVQKEIMKRLPANYPYSLDQALNQVKEHIPDFTMDELQHLMDVNKVGWIYDHGKIHIFKYFYATLIKTDPTFAARADSSLSGSEGALMEPEQSYTMRMQLMKQGTFSNRIHMRAYMKLKDKYFKPGMEVLVHLPIPADCTEQLEIQILSMYPGGQIAPSDAPQRTICWQETMIENHEFWVEYSYIYTARYHDTMKALKNGDSTDTDHYAEYKVEKTPHILFSPYIRSLAQSLTEGVTNPLEKAKIFYDFITLNMKYTFMPDYFVLEQIAESCARNYTGDCGVFALLFITLCRYSGIPARWQSGLVAEPDFVGAHDWAQFYVEPYGWLFADPSYGISCARQGNEERRNFYFGNIDSFRMIANNDFQEPFTIPKNHWRIDPYDNQYGEFETTEKAMESFELECDCEMIKYEKL